MNLPSFIRGGLSAALLLLLLGVHPASAQDTRVFTDDIGRAVSIPVKPQRIVALQDLFFTIPLIELGVPPVGSFGRTADDGSPYILSGRLVTGVDFDNSDIVYVGGGTPDLEAIAALKPDLIIAQPRTDAPVETMQAIAPTVVIDNGQHTGTGTYAVMADLAGVTERLAILEARYQSQIAQIRRVVDTENISVNIVYTYDGVLWSAYQFGALGQVLRDAGFRFPDVVEALGIGGEIEVGLERLQDLDADFVFMNYENDRGQTPQDVHDAMEAAVPGYCDFLVSCQRNQLIVLPHNEAVATSYYTLGLMAMTVLSHMSGVRIVAGDAAP